MQGTSHGISTRGQPPLVESHQEANHPGPGIVALGGCPGTLTLHESGDVLIQGKLGPIDLKVNGMRNTLRKNLASDPGAILLTLREVDHGLLSAPQIERRLAPVYGHTQRAHIGRGITVQELQK